jgi:hypothetical protein
MNRTVQQVIKYGERTDGIKLVWDRNVGLANVKFEQDNPDGLIYEGRATAIHVLNGGYLCYGQQTSGINLVWSQSPVYEWQIMRGAPPEPRDKVQSLDKIVLYNTKAQDYVIYCERRYGINLRWAEDCK